MLKKYKVTDFFQSWKIYCFFFLGMPYNSYNVKEILLFSKDWSCFNNGTILPWELIRLNLINLSYYLGETIFVANYLLDSLINS